MPNILYYPHYTPSELQLRSLLLFFDEVELIVPWCDRYNVEQRDHLAPLLEREDSVVKFHDPEDGYQDWAFRSGATEVLSQIIRKLHDSNEVKKLDDLNITLDDFRSDRSEEKLNELFSIGWRPIAFQKMNGDVFEEIQRAKLGLNIGMYRRPGTGEIVEQEAVLMHPEIGSFILSRLSREISERNNVASMTFNPLDFVSHTIEGYQDLSQKRYDLLSASIPLIIPDDVKTMDTKTFFQIRDDFKDLRKKLPRYLNGLVVDHNLDDKIAADNYLERLQTTAEKIEKDVQETKKSIGKNKFKKELNFSWGAVVAVSLAISGPDLHGFQIGLSAIAGYTATYFGNEFLLSSAAHPDEGIEMIARLNGAIGDRPATLPTNFSYHV